jgi:hypothetical protein
MAELPRELFKQILVCLGIGTVLPFSVWYGNSAWHTPPDSKQYYKSKNVLYNKISDSKSSAEKDKLRAEEDRIDKAYEAAEDAYYRAMFFVAFPVGILAVLIGLLYPIQAIGVGILLGGICTLVSGCYSYWDKMTDALRFGSTVAGLVVLLVPGTWRFARH